MFNLQQIADYGSSELKCLKRIDCCLLLILRVARRGFCSPATHHQLYSSPLLLEAVGGATQRTLKARLWMDSG